MKTYSEVMDTDEHPHIGVNYLYFGVFLALLLLISASGICIRDNLSGSRAFFFLYAFGQAILETSLFIFLSWMIRKILGNVCFALFIGATFVLLILHLIDFAIDRVLDLSIWETISFLLDQSFEDCIYLLDASGIPSWLWIAAFSTLALLPLFGFLIYKATELITHRKPIFLKREWFLQTFFCIPAALLLWDYSASNIIHPDTYTAFIKSLPWKFTFLPPETVLVDLRGSLRKPPKEEALAAFVAQNKTVLENKPNIYLFVIESFREDFVTEEIAPHFNEFKKSNISHEKSFSNANCTMISWFSIFHSQFPHYWAKVQSDGWKMGSPALALLKKWGYQINVLSSAQLAYYGMEELLFGKDKQLLDSYQTFHHQFPKQVYESDGEAFAELKKKASLKPEGQIFITFLDSTHFDYSWPKKEGTKFSPVASEFAYFKAFNSDYNIELIKNRYRNAIHYLDGLFGNFLESMPKKEDAIVIVVGDHGEEFFEHGHLFHCSHLVHEQMHIPLYFKFGKGERPVEESSIISQMDIFPTIVDYLSGSPVTFLEGRSLFQEERWPYAMIARFNAARGPYEFCIHNGEHKLVSQFQNRKDIFGSKALRIRSICGCNDLSVMECQKDLENWVYREFGSALDKLLTPIEASGSEAALRGWRFGRRPLSGQPQSPQSSKEGL